VSNTKKTPAPKIKIKTQVKGGACVMYSSAFKPRPAAKRKGSK
jgi:hypothetical protein